MRGGGPREGTRGAPAPTDGVRTDGVRTDDVLRVELTDDAARHGIGGRHGSGSRRRGAARTRGDGHDSPCGAGDGADTFACLLCSRDGGDDDDARKVPWDARWNSELGGWISSPEIHSFASLEDETD